MRAWSFPKCNTYIESTHMEKEGPVKIFTKTTFQEFYFFNCFTLISSDYVLSFALPKFIVPCDLFRIGRQSSIFLYFERLMNDEK